MFFLIRYDEIGLKGGNRTFFEKTLAGNIKNHLKNAAIPFELERPRGRIFIDNVPNESREIVEDILKRTPGISSYSKAWTFEKKDNFYSDTIAAVKEMLNEKKIGSSFDFKVQARRSDKYFPKSSYEICCEYGGAILEAFPEAKVNLHTPQLMIDVEVGEKIYIYAEKTICMGGLPVGSLGRSLLLLSGGLDSPVAAVKLATRGVSVHAIHFHAYPYTSEEAQEKIKSLIPALRKYTPKMNLYFLNFASIQQHILAHVKGRYFTIIMRRAMFKIAEKFATENKFISLATGESLGQVASQTMESIFCTNESVTLPILRPLICENKREIIEWAKEYGTYDISIRPFEDCCTIFNPPNPSTRPKIKEILYQENKIPDYESVLEEGFKNIEVITI